MSRTDVAAPRVIWLTLGGALLACLVLFAAGLLLTPPTQAQDLGLAISKTLRGSEVVQIGQVLEFSIRITNTGTLTVTEIDLVDEFVGAIVAPSGVGPFSRPGDPPLSDTAPYNYDGAETISWALLGGAAELPPGESLEVIVRLRAIRPTDSLQTVNFARIERAVRSDGQTSGGGSASAPARPNGARLPMSKTLGAPAPVASGLPITFTIVITNDSLVDIVSLPLRDVYNPAALRFESAQPPPLSVDQVGGVLVWDDLLTITGRRALAPGESLTVVTVYTALRDITSAVNTAEVRGARDEYDNAVEPAQAQAPIRIVGPTATATATASATATATAAPTEAPTDEPSRPRPSATAPATATIAATAALTATVEAPTATLEQPSATAEQPSATAEQPTAAPAGGQAGGQAGASAPTRLPRTGVAGAGWGLWAALGLALVVAGALWRRRV